MTLSEVSTFRSTILRFEAEVEFVSSGNKLNSVNALRESVHCESLAALKSVHCESLEALKSVQSKSLAALESVHCESLAALKSVHSESLVALDSVHCESLAALAWWTPSELGPLECESLAVRE